MKKYILIAIMLIAAYNMFCCDMAAAISTNGNNFSWNEDPNLHCCVCLNNDLNACNHPDGRAVILHTTYDHNDGIYSRREHSTSNLSDSWKQIITSSNVMLNHARKGTSGSSQKAFHPFIWESRTNGRTYSFMANGTVDQGTLEDLLTEGADDDWLSDAFDHLHSHEDNVNQGITIENICDSEFYFYWLIKNIEANRDVLKGLQQALYRLDQEISQYCWRNFMFSDGQYLYLYKAGERDTSNPYDYEHRIYYGEIVFHPEEDPNVSEYPDLYIATTQNVGRDIDGDFNYYDPLPEENELDDGELVVISKNGACTLYPNFDNTIPEVNYFAVDGVNWKCFPVDYSGLYADDQIEETYDYFLNLYHWEEGMQSVPWVSFSSLDLLYTKGYKLELDGIGGFSLLSYDLKGVHVFEDREITLDAQQNRFWIPYFNHETISPFDAFEDIIDSAVKIQSKFWTMWRKNTNSKWTVGMHVGSHRLCCYYGKMYDVTLVSGHPTVMDYYGVTGYGESAEYIPLKTEYYECDEKMEYEAILIDTISGNETIKEVAVFEGDDCIGASVFEGYPVFIRAFTDELNRSNEPLEFRVYTGSRTEPDVEYRVFDDDFAYYRDESMYPRENVITRVCLGLNGEEMPIMSDKLVRTKQYPDPFNPETAIEYSIPEAGNVSIEIYNIKGQKVKSLISSEQAAGLHKVIWNGTDNKGRSSASGMYFYVLKYNEQIVREKMLMVK